MSDAHLQARSTCSALVITCSDFRFKRAERAFLEAAGLNDDYDLIARPGASRSLAAPRSEAARATMVEEVRMLHAAHGFARILLVHHESCRGYDDLTAGGAGEHAVHAEHIAAAREALARLLPGAVAEGYIVALVDGAHRVLPLPGA